MRFGHDRASLAVDNEFQPALAHRQRRWPEDVLKGCRQRIGLGFVEPRANDQRRFRCNQRDLERLRRNGLDVAQAGRGKCGVHAGEAGSYDDK